MCIIFVKWRVGSTLKEQITVSYETIRQVIFFILFESRFHYETMYSDPSVKATDAEDINYRN